MEVKGYFSTPIWREKISVNDLWKSFAFKYIENSKMIGNSASDKLSHSQYISPGPLNDSKSEKLTTNRILEVPEFQELKGMIMGILEKCFIEYYGETIKDNDVLLAESWLNQCDKGGSQYAHNHANSLLSYTLYLNYDFHKGHSPLYFERPNSNTAPYFSSLGWTKWTASRNIFFELEEGDLLVWPSHIFHGYFTNKADKRITLSGNALLRKIYNEGYSLEVKD